MCKTGLKSLFAIGNWTHEEDAEKNCATYFREDVSCVGMCNKCPIQQVIHYILCDVILNVVCKRGKTS